MYEEDTPNEPNKSDNAEIAIVEVEHGENGAEEPLIFPNGSNNQNHNIWRNNDSYQMVK